MKIHLIPRLNILLINLVIFNLAVAQNNTIYGVMYEGGTDNIGTVFKIKENGDSFKIIHDFKITAGVEPVDALCKAGDGYYYGLTKYGGHLNNGTLYRIDNLGNFESLIEFKGSNGSHPTSRLLLGKSGNLYGTTEDGGSWGDGVIFEYDIDDNEIHLLHVFNRTSHLAKPRCGLVELDSGVFYGTATKGKPHGDGGVFCYDINNDSIKVVASFKSSNIHGSYSGLVKSKDNQLYGCLAEGGSDNVGGIYKVDLNGDSIITLLEMREEDGASLWNLPYLYEDSMLYITCTNGGIWDRGSIIGYNLVKDSLEILHRFTESTNFRSPAGSPVVHQHKIYGVLGSQGIYCYNIFHDSLEYITNSNLPSNSNQSLLNLNDSILIGISYDNTTQYDGSLFLYNVKTRNAEEIIAFGIAQNGAQPIGGLTYGSDHMIYGTTNVGGLSGNRGCIFSIDPSNDSFKSVLDIPKGEKPAGRLLGHYDGNLYGVLLESTSTSGHFFKFNPINHSYEDTLLNNDVRQPTDGLVMNSNGEMFGTSTFGGVSNTGTIFSIDKNFTNVTVLNTFNTTTGTRPSGGVIEINGSLYGCTFIGGNNGSGSLFELNLSNNSLDTVYSHKLGTSNSATIGKLTYDSVSGKIYGLSPGGGSDKAGILFSYNLSNEVFQELKSLDKDQHGSGFASELMISRSGKLYGVTRVGGLYNNGALICYNPSTDSLYTIHHFKKEEGSGAYKARLLEQDDTLSKKTTNIKKLKSLKVLSIYPNPSTGIIKIKTSGSSTIAHINVYNTRGQLESNIEVDISSEAHIQLPAAMGVYYLEIVLNDGSSSMQRVLKI